ncbi:hypothetical protein TNCV_3789551 [Trichonephila clavipes]|nr:hypothetical protein TNCV_3789551 [Trichonephila clavipes]
MLDGVLEHDTRMVDFRPWTPPVLKKFLSAPLPLNIASFFRIMVSSSGNTQDSPCRGADVRRTKLRRYEVGSGSLLFNKNDPFLDGILTFDEETDSMQQQRAFDSLARQRRSAKTPLENEAALKESDGFYYGNSRMIHYFLSTGEKNPAQSLRCLMSSLTFLLVQDERSAIGDTACAWLEICYLGECWAYNRFTACPLQPNAPHD